MFGEFVHIDENCALGDGVRSFRFWTTEGVWSLSHGELVLLDDLGVLCGVCLLDDLDVLCGVS